LDSDFVEGVKTPKQEQQTVPEVEEVEVEDQYSDEIFEIETETQPGEPVQEIVDVDPDQLEEEPIAEI
jgi:hypothetical protein